MGSNSEIKAFIGIITLVVIGVAILGLVEERVTGILTETKTQISIVRYINTDSDTMGPVSGSPAFDDISWYANRVQSSNGQNVRPPGYEVHIERKLESLGSQIPLKNINWLADIEATGTCASSNGWILNSSRNGLVCEATVEQPLSQPGELGAPGNTHLILTYKVSGYLLEKTGKDIAVLSMFKTVPFLVILGMVVMAMAATVYMSIANDILSMRNAIIQFLLLAVGFVLFDNIVNSLDDARETFSYAAEFPDMTEVFSLVILLYAITLIVGLVGASRASYAILSNKRR